MSHHGWGGVGACRIQICGRVESKDVSQLESISHTCDGRKETKSIAADENRVPLMLRLIAGKYLNTESLVSQQPNVSL